MTTMEAQFRGLSKTSDKDGDWFKIVLWVHPDDCPDELFHVKLRSRLGVALVQISDDEQEKPVKRRSWEELPLSEQAGIRCNDKAFRKWLYDKFTSTDTPSNIVRNHCGVTTRAELNINQKAADTWRALDAKFIADTRLPEQR